jgi:hypothetical protein
MLVLTALELVFWLQAMSYGAEASVATDSYDLADRWSSGVSLVDADVDQQKTAPAAGDLPEQQELRHSEDTGVHEPKIEKPHTQPTNTPATDSRSSNSRHESPPQRPKKGKCLGDVEENQLVPGFAWWMALLAFFLSTWSLLDRVASASEPTDPHYVIAALVRPFITAHHKYIALAVDFNLLAIFASTVHHLGECSVKGCHFFSLDGVAIVGCLLSVFTLLKLKGGKWVVKALGFAPPAPIPRPLLRADEKVAAKDVGIVGMEVYFPQRYVQQSDLGAPTPPLPVGSVC